MTSEYNICLWTAEGTLSTQRKPTQGELSFCEVFYSQKESEYCEYQESAVSTVKVQAGTFTDYYSQVYFHILMATA